MLLTDWAGLTHRVWPVRKLQTRRVDGLTHRVGKVEVLLTPVLVMNSAQPMPGSTTYG